MCLPVNMLPRKKIFDRTMFVFLWIKPEVLEAFRAKCDARGTTPTAEIKKFISEYCEEPDTPG